MNALGPVRDARRLSVARSGAPVPPSPVTLPCINTAELKLLVGEGAMWPSRRQFERAGLRSMLIAIYRYEGPAY